MARKPRVHFPGAFYHVISRGNNRQAIFKDDSDRKRYLSLLQEVPKRYGCKIYAYTLMPNHVHLLIEVGGIALSNIMQTFQFRYTQYYNRRYKRSGHLFQGRYKAILCDRESYLLELVRYIHLNSVRAGLVQNVDHYPWSSQWVYARGEANHSSVSTGFVLGQFGRNRKEAVQRYREFIKDGIKEGHREDYYRVADQRFLGDEEFIDKAHERAQEPEVKYPVNIRLEEVVRVACSEFGVADGEKVLDRSRTREMSQIRWIVSKVAIEEGGYRMADVARFFRRDPAVISRGLRSFEERLSRDKRLRENIRRLQENIRKGRKRRIAIRQA